MKFSIKKTFSRLLFIVLALVILGGWCNFTFAKTDSDDKKGYTLLTPLPGTTQDCTTDESGKINCTTDIKTYIPGIFNLTIGIAGVLAVLMILIGGVEYITTDAIWGKHDGKARINNALLGLVLVLVSWILLRTINPQLTDFDLTIKNTTATKNSEATTEYTGTGVEIASEEKTASSKNAEGYMVSQHTLIKQYQDGGESSVVTETYIDKNGDTYTTRTTKDRNAVSSTERSVQYLGKSEDTQIDENGNEIKPVFDGWDGN